MENYRLAEALESILEQHQIPILPALAVDGKKMLETDGQFFYLYDWYDGKTLKDGEITEDHCAKIGKILARIHKIEWKQEAYVRDEIHIDWDFYIGKLAECNKELHFLLKENRDLLVESQEKGNGAIKRMPPVMAIYTSPFLELYEVALCWAGYQTGAINYKLLEAMIQSYAEAGGVLSPDWETIYDCNFGRLEWLEYNLKRSLGMECTREEITPGISEVRKTISQVIRYWREKENILSCLNEIKNSE